MTPTSFWPRLQGYYQRSAAALVFKKPLRIHTPQPVISFTFDDFPRSALLEGGAILERHGLAGTYYTSIGLRGTDTPTGRIFDATDLTAVIERGHELGCHTFSHCHSWETATPDYERSVLENREALERYLPAARFRTFSYPISPPRPRTKARVARYFDCCRGGGQTFNAGTADLNQLSAFFLEKTQHHLHPVKEIIDRNAAARGWLIFATHDVSERPTRFGCVPVFFEAVVRYAVRSGARILPVGRALDSLHTR